MSEKRVFHDVVQADLERIPLLDAVHVERFNGCDYLISQVVVKNVFTNFDRQLSRHLAATRGGGFPRYTVFVRFREKAALDKWRSFEPTQHASVPHALRAIAERAVSFGLGGGISLRHVGRRAGSEEVSEHALEREDVNALTDALDICESIGEPEFMEISGDFDILICRPPADQRPITMYLRKGSVSVPGGRTAGSLPFECPIAGFRHAIRADAGAQGYIAAARHALAAAKESAVSDFRAAAEAQIMAFDLALRDRPLDGHRLEAAVALVARLKAGLGEELRGVTEAARITALEWSLAFAGLDCAGPSHITADAETAHQATA